MKVRMPIALASAVVFVTNWSVLINATAASPVSDVPTFFKVYNRDGSNTVSAYCVKTGTDSITCNFTAVEFQQPEPPERLDTSLESMVKTDPKLAEEWRKNPQKATEKWKANIEELKEEVCSPSSKTRMEKAIREPQIGPKRKRNFEQALEACSDKISAESVQKILDIFVSQKKRTCALRVANFSVDFKRIGKGQWYSNGEPQGLCNVVRSYTLKQEEEKVSRFLWTLTETTVAVGSNDALCKDLTHSEVNKQTTWTWNNYNDFEVSSCDFIEAKYILPDPPTSR